MSRRTIRLTAKQSDAVYWGLDPMYDYWCTPEGAEERNSNEVYSENDLPILKGLFLSLSQHAEINEDLAYRVGVQLVDMVDQQRIDGWINNRRAYRETAELDMLAVLIRGEHA